MDAIFKGIFDNELTQLISVQDFLLCLGVSLVLGLIMAAAYMFKNEHTKSFLVTLALLCCPCIHHSPYSPSTLKR